MNSWVVDGIPEMFFSWGKMGEKIYKRMICWLDVFLNVLYVFTYILGPANYFHSQLCFESFQSSTFTIWSWANFRAWSSLPAALTYRTCYEYLPSNGLPSILQLWWCIQRPEKYSSCSILSRHLGWALAGVRRVQAMKTLQDVPCILGCPPSH